MSGQTSEQAAAIGQATGRAAATAAGPPGTAERPAFVALFAAAWLDRALAGLAIGRIVLGAVSRLAPRGTARAFGVGGARPRSNRSR